MLVQGGVDIRASWFDRNPAIISDDFIGAYANHTAAMRSAYIITGNKKARMGAIFLMMSNDVAPTVNNSASIWITHTPLGGSEIVIARAYRWWNGQRQEVVAQTNMNLILVKDDLIRIYTNNLTTGAVINYSATWSATTFDA